MNQTYQSIILAVVIVIGIIGGQYYLSLQEVNKENLQTIRLVIEDDCNILESECRFLTGSDVIRLKFIGTPRTMQRFKLAINTEGFHEKVNQVTVIFSMKSMDMGLNKFKLKQQNQVNTNHWQSSILLPVCTSKRTDWEMLLRINTSSKRYSIVVPLQIK